MLRNKNDCYTIETKNDCYAVCYSPDGRIFAAAMSGGSVCLREGSLGDTKLKLDCPFTIKNPTSLCFSPQGNLLATGSSKSLILWDVKTGQQKANLNIDSLYSSVVSFAPIDISLAYTDRAYTSIYDYNTGQIKYQFNTNYSSSLSFQPYGILLASGNQNYIDLWDYRSKKQTAKFVVGGFIKQVCFSPDGNTLASCGGESDKECIQFWDVNMGLSKSKIVGKNPNQICFSSDGNTLAAACYSDVQFWNLQTGTKYFDQEIHKGYQVYSLSLQEVNKYMFKNTRTGLVTGSSRTICISKVELQAKPCDGESKKKKCTIQ